MGDSDWDSEPEEERPTPALSTKTNGAVPAAAAVQEEKGESRGSRARTRETGSHQRPPPAASPRPSLRRPVPQTQKPEPEPEPPFDFRLEAEAEQRASKQRSRPPGRQQKSEYTVSSDETAPPANTGSREQARKSSVTSAGLPPAAGQTVSLSHPEEAAEPRFTVTPQEMALKPLGSPALSRGDPGTPRHLLTHPEQDGTRSDGEPAVTKYHFSKPSLRTLSESEPSQSRLLAQYGASTRRHLMRMWAEVLWVLSVPVLVITTLLYSLLRCVLESVVRPVTLGPLLLLGDHLLKPAAVAVHDALLLPLAALVANLTAALALVGQPLARLLEALVRPLAALLSSCRLVQINYGPAAQPAAAQQLLV